MAIKKYILGIIVFLCFADINVAADERVKNVFDLRTISCEKFLGLKEQSRDYLFFFLYGFSSGKEHDFTHSVREIENVVEAAGDICIDNPKMKIINVLNTIKGLR